MLLEVTRAVVNDHHQRWWLELMHLKGALLRWFYADRLIAATYLSKVNPVTLRHTIGSALLWRLTCQVGNPARIRRVSDCFVESEHDS